MRREILNNCAPCTEGAFAFYRARAVTHRLTVGESVGYAAPGRCRGMPGCFRGMKVSCLCAANPTYKLGVKGSRKNKFRYSVAPGPRWRRYAFCQGNGHCLQSVPCQRGPVTPSALRNYSCASPKFFMRRPVSPPPRQSSSAPACRAGYRGCRPRRAPIGGARQRASSPRGRRCGR